MYRIRLLSILAAALLLCDWAAATAARPNIVVIMADDIGAECYGAYGSTFYKTPRIDGLAETGAKFTHAYAQPLCTPSRVKIMTGRYNFRNYRDFGAMDVTQPTFATMMRDAGYKTFAAGKWQLTPGDLKGPSTAGFDEYCLWHFLDRGEGSDSEFDDKGSRYQSPVLYQNGKLMEGLEGKYGPQVAADAICDFMERSKDEPFFVYYPMMLVHGPYQATPESADWPGMEKDPKHFPDMVAYMDKCIGQIADKLDALGIRDNTLLIVTGDNGTGRDIQSPMPDGTLFKGGKGSMTDAGTRVAFVANWPGQIAPGTVVDAPIDLADVMPTMAEASGATLPGTVDGVSLLPLMRGDSSQARGWIFMSYSKNGPLDKPFRCFVRDQRWKLYNDGSLYDTTADPDEKSPSLGEEADAARGRLAPTLNRLMAEVRTAEAAANKTAEKPEKLNVLHIMSDDLFSSLGSYGNAAIKTPNLDRLAERGVRFDRAYCQYPLCNASRASYMTGLRPDTTQTYANATYFREGAPDAVSLPQSFRSAGYHVARVGKIYHYGVPSGIGTDGLDDPASWEAVVNPKGRDVDEFSLVEIVGLDENGKTVATPGHSLGSPGGTLSWHAADGADGEQTDGIGAAAAIKILEERAADGAPFYLAVGFYRPHTPFVAPKAYFDMYPLDQIQLPEIAPDNDARFPWAALESRKPEETGMDESVRRRAIQAYYASTTFMDAQAGRVLDALERLGLAENTVVVFHSDHGYHLGEKNLWKKQSLFEESARVPLIVAAPGRNGNGKASTRVVELLNLHKTLADLCGIAADSKTEGESLVPLLDNPAAPWDRPAYTQVMRFNRRNPGKEPYMGRSIRTERWRYTEWDGGKQGAELYDHDADPNEMNNLASDPAHEAVVKELRGLIAANS